MKFMLLQSYGGVPEGVPPMGQWAPEEVKAHIDFQVAMNVELRERGELVDAQALTPPEAARFVVHDGKSAPVITDGPFRRRRSCWPATGRSTSSRSNVRSRSRPRRRRRPAPVGSRSGRRSRFAR